MERKKMMEKNIESKDLEQLLIEADELVQQINSDAVKYMEEEHRLQFEIQVQNLKKIKSKVQDEIGKEGTEIGSGAVGMHKAIQDIVKAMKDLRNRLLSFPSDTFESPLKKRPSLN
jgi:hypothetical protein